MLVLDIIGWTLLIASNVLPEKWFKTKSQMYGTRITCCGIALAIFTTQLANLWFEWY
jgi:hypothetical protein